MAQAFKLKFTGATTGALAERVDLASEITLNANTATNSLRVEIEFELDSLSATNTLCFAANFCRFQILNTGQISVQYRNQTNSLAPVTSATGAVSTGVRYVLALQLSNVDRNARIFLNDVEVGTVTNRWGTFSIDRLGLWPSNSTLNGSIYRVTCYQNGTIVNNYNPTIVLADPNTLVDTVVGNNGTMVNFPTDGSARVPYDDGAGGEEQITSSGGIASALAGGGASTQIIHEQVISASGIAVAMAAGIASISVINEQVNSTGGITSAITSAIASASVINQQVFNSGGVTTAVAGASASTQVINEQTSEQVVSSGGISASIGSASASTQVIHEQVINSGGVAVSLAGGMASSTVIEDYAIVQVVQSGGISSAYMSGIASTIQVVEQIVSSGGIAAAVMTGSASTTVREFTGDWGAPEILFSEAQPIEQISLTFDQLGRPLVFYRVGESTLKLYWYDPVAQQNVTTTLTTGKDPTACFDFPQDTGQSFTDALLFYVRDDQVFMRIQRDRYAIEYPCPAIQPGLKINSAGLRVDNRLQVVYQFKDTGYVPPVVPVPPVEIPGKFYYLQPYISAIHTAAPLISNRYNWQAGFSLRGYDTSSAGIKALLSQGTNNMPLSFAPAVRLASSLLVAYFRSQVGVNGTFVVRINGREHFFVSSEPLQDGVYELTAAGNSFSIARNGNVIAAGNLMPAPNANDNGPLAFGSNVHLFNNNIVPGPGYSAIEGYIYNAWLDAGETRYDWPLLDKGEPLQPSVPPGQPITLNQHRPENWRFVQD